MKRILTYATLVALLVTSICAPGVVHAEDSSQGMVVTPPTFELSANPGDITTSSIRVDNLTSAPLHITHAFKNFAAIGEEGQVGLSEEESSFSLASWITMDKTEATIQPKGSETFTFSIKVPSNAEPGGRFGSIVFKTDVQSTTATGGLAIGQEIGVLVLLRVAGEVTELATIEDFKTLRGFYEYGPIEFESRLKNEGNVHIKPTGTITVSNFFGRKVATIPIDSKNVLPDAIRKLNTEWGQHSLFGKYTATLSLQYGANQQIITASTTFVVIPWKLVLVWLIILGAIGFLAYRGRQRIKKAVSALLGKE